MVDVSVDVSGGGGGREMSPQSHREMERVPQAVKKNEEG